MKPKINIVMVGHIDHGKSTLIGRLLFDTKSIKPGKLKEIEETSKQLGKDFEYAFVLDSFQEEREQGITIDTTEIPFETEKYRYNIIDAPGHREFIKNMLSGASHAEAAVVMVSAKSDEGVQEQTRRHTFLLKMFGIKQVFFAINKMDTVDYSKERFEEIKNKTTEFLESLGYGESLYFVPISSKEGENIITESEKMSWYEGLPLVPLLDETIIPKESPEKRPLRLPVQYVLKNDTENIIMGRVESGTVKSGDSIVFEPSNIQAEIERIEERDIAKPGDSIGFRLRNNTDIKRGQVMGYIDNPPKIFDSFESKVFILSKKGVNVGDKVDFRCGTSLVNGEIIGISKRTSSETGKMLEENSQKLELDDVGILNVKLSEPMVLEKFNDIPELGRFMIENLGDVLAAGIVSKI